MSEIVKSILNELKTKYSNRSVEFQVEPLYFDFSNYKRYRLVIDGKIVDAQFTDLMLDDLAFVFKAQTQDAIINEVVAALSYEIDRIIPQ